LTIQNVLEYTLYIENALNWGLKGGFIKKTHIEVQLKGNVFEEQPFTLFEENP
jgi:hypothetical protein